MPPRRAAYAALVVLALINLLNYMDRYVLSGVLPLVKSEFALSDTALGVLTASFLVVYAVAAPFTGIQCSMNVSPGMNSGTKRPFESYIGTVPEASVR